MVDAARKYKRVVQAGTCSAQRAFFQKAREIVKKRRSGQITFCAPFRPAWQEGKLGPSAGFRSAAGPGLGSVARTRAQAAPSTPTAGRGEGRWSTFVTSGITPAAP